MFISGTSTRSNERSSSPVFPGSGFRWRMCAVASLSPFSAQPPGRALDGPVARAPAEHEQRRAVGIVHLDVRDVHAGDPLGPQVRHVLVVGGLVGDVAGAVLLLEPADAVAQPGVPGTAHGRARSALRA